MTEDPRIVRILGGHFTRTELIAAAYADSSWDKICTALNIFEKFTHESSINPSWPLDSEVISNFIHWATFVRKISPSTIVSYLSHIRLIHDLRGLDSSACRSFICKTQIRGAQNLTFYEPASHNNKKVLTLPLLKILGHAIAKLDWSGNSKSVIWTASCIGFFGSFRFGELLSKNETSFNEFETLLWKDVKFFDDNSVLITNKIPKTRSKNESVSLFEFPGHNCCPIEAIKHLKLISNATDDLATPVFAFQNGRFLTLQTMNRVIVSLLKPYLGVEAHSYSCKSFRAALPSALAACNDDDIFIKRWGRWNSDAFERYTRLNHLARKKLFSKFSSILGKKL